VTWLGSGNLAVKRAVFGRIGGFNPELTACEDVDFCNRLRNSGARIVADPAMRSVHFGDPRTLRALFFGELWRGRNNLSVTLSGPKTVRDLRSGLIPLAQLGLLIVCAVALALQWWWIAAVALLKALAPAVVRAGVILRRRWRPTMFAAIQAFAVAVTYDFARAMAIVAHGSHRARRSA
jgi:GT2 family glycosyltransferase